MNKLLIFLLLLIILLCCFNNNNENFKGLYPVHGTYCEKRGLKKSYMPQPCILKDGCINKHSNCRCVNPKTGLCEICYPPSKKQFVNLVDNDHHKHIK